MSWLHSSGKQCHVIWSALNMKVANSTEMLVLTYQTTCHRTREDMSFSCPWCYSTKKGHGPQMSEHLPFTDKQDMCSLSCQLEATSLHCSLFMWCNVRLSTVWLCCLNTSMCANSVTNVWQASVCLASSFSATSDRAPTHSLHPKCTLSSLCLGYSTVMLNIEVCVIHVQLCSA